MSRTWKDRKGYKTKNRRPSYTTNDYQNRCRGGYEDYDHSDQELYVDDQCCDNCRYRGNCSHTPFPSGWCEYWQGERDSAHQYGSRQFLAGGA